jgi:hypothetical protein
LESPQAIRENRELQWTGRPSEEQLLGSPLLAASSPPAVSFEPPPLNDWSLPDDVAAPREPSNATPRWRPHARDLIALAAVAAAVWFAVRGDNGIPFRSVEGATPTSADGVTARVASDRQELSSLPREASTAAAGGPAADHGHGAKNNPGSPGSRDGRGKDDPPATAGGNSQDPLLQATVPGVGSVTVEQPTVPDTGLPLPDGPGLPKTEVRVPETVTVSLP